MASSAGRIDELTPEGKSLHGDQGAYCYGVPSLALSRLVERTGLASVISSAPSETRICQEVGSILPWRPRLGRKNDRPRKRDLGRVEKSSTEPSGKYPTPGCICR